jgi:hypothetical protein
MATPVKYGGITPYRYATQLPEWIGVKPRIRCSPITLVSTELLLWKTVIVKWLK